MDALAEVLAVARVRGTVAATVNAAEPWGLSLGAVSGAAFHTLTHGTAWLRMGRGPDIRLMPGDVVLLPTGVAHSLMSATGVRCEPFDHVAAAQALVAGDEMQLGSGVAQTRILCAYYKQDPAIMLPILSLLPEILHIDSAHANGGLQTTVKLLSEELASPQPGARAVLNNVVDLLFIQVLRSWLANSVGSTDTASWLRGLRDPVVGPALAAMHAQPGKGWTLSNLANHTGVSRATLARRFTSEVGDTPAAYLTKWRMDLAAARLRDGDEPIGVIARSIGYTSEYAFNRAFSRARHVSPGRYRTQTNLS